MTVGEMISLLSTSQAQGFGRPLLVSILNMLQNAFYKHECEMTLIHDSTTGKLPFIATTAKKFEYSLPAYVWRVANVLTRLQYDYDYDYYDYDGLGYQEAPPVNKSVPVVINGNKYYPYQQVKTFDSRTIDGEESGARLLFTRDPGDSTTKFYYQGYMVPYEQLTSDRQNLSIPDSDGAHLLIVFPCFTKLIEARNNGNYEEAMQYIAMKRMELWNNVMSAGAQGNEHRTTRRAY